MGLKDSLRSFIIGCVMSKEASFSGSYVVKLKIILVLCYLTF